MGPRAQEKRLALARSRSRSSTQREGRKVGSGIIRRSAAGSRGEDVGCAGLISSISQHLPGERTSLCTSISEAPAYRKFGALLGSQAYCQKRS